ncbi:O-antigen ligase family protein [Nocardioides sp. zg-536]|uniref:O-antigen ligase family protein n=1 Tax=Nocardioides faecalis TaxID=2803858 RepID=A0A938XY94_9ACTN|nr:O-antigen ligase family protein [Nocardioides faecalis]MBM9458386.1 O-antigen ligase family protein [Nocardioides faecalis]QVI58405.1 O-antigen ligase family protein [Nocardioides faecalis]
MAAQFVDVTLGSAGSFVISAQKLVAILILPLGVVLMRRLVVPGALVALSAIIVLAFCAGPLLSDTPKATLFASVLAILLNLASAIVLYSALTRDRAAIGLFAWVWIAASAVTAAVCLGQMLGALPLYTVTEEALSRRDVVAGLRRGTGFKFDPNFAAMMLVVGLGFVRTLVRPPARWLLSLLLIVGIICTFSRMGLIVAAIVMIMSSGGMHRSSASRVVGRAGALIAVGVVGRVLYEFTSGQVRDYVDSRTQDLMSGVDLVLGRNAGASSTGSAVERADLVGATVGIIRDHWMFGLGPNNLQEELAWAIGADKGAHNTYLESLAIGGIFGLLGLIFYFAICRTSLRSLSAQAAPGSLANTRRAVSLLCLSAALMAVVLTINYNSFLFLPITVALAFRCISAPVDNERGPGEVASVGKVQARAW